MVTGTMPREPKWEYSCGRSRDLADVGGLVQHRQQRRVQPAAAGFGGADGGAQHLVGQRGHQRGGGAGAVLGQQVQGVGGNGERGEVHCGQWRRGWGDPGHDVRVGQARRGGAGGLVHAVAGFRGAGLPAGHRAGGGVEAVLEQDPDRFVAGDVGQPGLHVGEGAAVVGGGEEERGEQVLGGEDPEVLPTAAVGADGVTKWSASRKASSHVRAGSAGSTTRTGGCGRWPAGRTPTPARPVRRAALVVAHTSGLLEVASTAPGASSITGMVSAVVLPARGAITAMSTSSIDAYSTAPPRRPRPNRPRVWWRAQRHPRVTGPDQRGWGGGQRWA